MGAKTGKGSARSHSVTITFNDQERADLDWLMKRLDLSQAAAVRESISDLCKELRKSDELAKTLGDPVDVLDEDIPL